VDALVVVVVVDVDVDVVDVDVADGNDGTFKAGGGFGVDADAGLEARSRASMAAILASVLCSQRVSDPPICSHFSVCTHIRPRVRVSYRARSSIGLGDEALTGSGVAPGKVDDADAARSFCSLSVLKCSCIDVYGVEYQSHSSHLWPWLWLWLQRLRAYVPSPPRIEPRWVD